MVAACMGVRTGYLLVAGRFIYGVNSESSEPDKRHPLGYKYRATEVLPSSGKWRINEVGAIEIDATCIDDVARALEQRASMRNDYLCWVSRQEDVRDATLTLRCARLLCTRFGGKSARELSQQEIDGLNTRAVNKQIAAKIRQGTPHVI